MTEDPKVLWERCLEFFKDNLPTDEQYAAWFKPLTFLGFNEGAPLVGVPSLYFKEQLELRYLKLICAGIRKYFGQPKLYYQYLTSGNQAAGAPLEVTPVSQGAKPRQGSQSNPFAKAGGEERTIDSQLNPNYSFENYCISASNNLAASIALTIAEKPQIKTFNPFFIFGSTGVGKTHLIQAIGLRIREHDPEAKVLYVTARLFESQFTTASANHKINEFIRFYQGIDTLIIDDIQDLGGNKPATQNAFFHIFNQLHQNQKQLIMSSDCCPSDMKGFEERLLSRFKWGATVELERPDYALRRAFLDQRCRQDGLEIDASILDMIAQNITGSIRELEGVIVSLLAHATSCNCEIDRTLASKVIGNAVKIHRRQLNFELITASVTDYYHLTPDVIFTRNRKREVSDARQIIMYMARKHVNLSLTSIGARLQRNHATVFHACQAVEDRLATDRQFQAEVAEIEALLLN